MGQVVAADMAKLGISSVRDLLFTFPFRYDDFSKFSKISDLVPGEVATVQGRVVTIKSWRSPKKRMMLTEAIVEDETGKVKVIWFNQSYLAKSLRAGTEVSLSGKVDDKYGLAFTNPIHEVLRSADTFHTGRIVPIYSLTGSLTVKRLRAAIQSALPATAEIVEWLPLGIREQENFVDLPEAIRAIHYPEDQAGMAKAVRRLKFDELFLHQLMFARARAKMTKLTAHLIERNKKAEASFLTSFPFQFTSAQSRSTEEILTDLAEDKPMNRLLEGDVGSGKSAVAACAIEQCVRSGFQAVYLAPTEILAKQQYAELREVLGDYQVALLTQNRIESGDSEISKNEIKDQLVDGRVDLVVATHAILQSGYGYKKLGLVVIDEQHRFGVRQRQKLLHQPGSVAPHLLSMSATPIPRSLALAIYGDLDISIIDELPPGREPIETKIVGKKNMASAIKLIDVMIAKGHQIYAVCPLIDPSDKLGATSVTEFAEELKGGPLGKHRIEILHGKLKPKDKAEVIERFKNGEIDILVSTTVIEVGVNIPNATVMYIEGAERFGLAQLHQLRGRVGRSSFKSFCLLHSESTSLNTRDRLQAMVKCQNGFELAEEDLELRGSGNIFGTEQSGFIDFALATLADVELMKKAHDWAKKILSIDSDLADHPQLADMIDKQYQEVHFE